MEIPEGAYTAAGEAVGKVGLLKASPEVSHIIVEAIQAAAPFVAAQALRDAADALDQWHTESLGGGDWDRGFTHATDMLNDRADEMDEQ